MIRLLIFFIFFTLTAIKAQDNPKNIISNENNNILFEEESDVKEENNLSLETNNSIELEENLSKYNMEQVDDSKSIVVRDMPNDDNFWYGTLSSENNGLGWMMWGNTSFSLSKTLIDRINPSTKSPTLRILLRNIMLSRAKSPAIKSKEIADEYLANSVGYDLVIIASHIDAFYSNSDNYNIPILEALRIVSLVQDGEQKKANIRLLRAQQKNNNFQLK